MTPDAVTPLVKPEAEDLLACGSRRVGRRLTKPHPILAWRRRARERQEQQERLCDEFIEQLKLCIEQLLSEYLPPGSPIDIQLPCAGDPEQQENE